MAEISKSGVPSLASPLIDANDKISGLLAGEAIGGGDAVYIKTADNRIWRSTGAAANAAAVVDGFAALPASAGEAVTPVFNCTINYGAALSPGSFLYLSGTVAGGLADAASTGGTMPVARVIDPTRISVFRSYGGGSLT